jgi:hypothetical protein
MGEDSYWEDRHELAQYEEPSYEHDERPCPMTTMRTTSPTR